MKILHAFEFVGQPEFGIDRLKVAYEWDLTLGAKRWQDITEEDIRRAFTENGELWKGDAAIDLEPDVTPTHNPITRIVPNIRRLLEIAVMAKAVLGRTVSMYGLGPTFRDPYLTDPTHMIGAQAGNLVMSNLIAPSFGRPNNILFRNAFDLYRGPESEWEAHDSSMEPQLFGAVKWSIPLEIWMSPFRRDGAGAIPLELFRADLHRVASILDKYDPDGADPHAMVIWAPRAAMTFDRLGRPVLNANGTPRWDPIEWERWPWIDVVDRFCQDQGYEPLTP